MIPAVNSLALIPAVHALNDGFLKASNNEKMKFALMWANQVRYCR